MNHHRLEAVPWLPCVVEFELPLYIEAPSEECLLLATRPGAMHAPLLRQRLSGGAERVHVHSTGVPRSYETATPLDPTVGLCLWPYGGSRGGGFLVGEVPLYRQPPSYPTQRARKGYLSDSDHLSVTFSVRTPLCPYGIAHHRVIDES